jgi:hypothetical protein
MTNFLLDVFIEDTQFATYLRNLRTPVWLLFQADGVRKSVTTPQVQTRSTAVFNFAIRLVLILPHLDKFYFKTSLCTLGENGTEVRIIANSQIRFTSLPTEPTRQFTYPLLSLQDHSMEVAIVSARASIKPLNLEAEEVIPTGPPRPRGPPGSGPPQGPGGWPPRRGYPPFSPQGRRPPQ